MFSSYSHLSILLYSVWDCSHSKVFSILKFWRNSLKFSSRTFMVTFFPFKSWIHLQFSLYFFAGVYSIVQYHLLTKPSFPYWFERPPFSQAKVEGDFQNISSEIFLSFSTAQCPSAPRVCPRRKFLPTEDAQWLLLRTSCGRKVWWAALIGSRCSGPDTASASIISQAPGLLRHQQWRNSSSKQKAASLLKYESLGSFAVLARSGLVVRTITENSLQGFWRAND